MSPLKISPEVRKKIIEKLLSTPERKALWKEVESAVERILALPESKRAYLHGSFITKKPNPQDVDLMLRVTNKAYENEVLNVPEHLRPGNFWPLKDAEVKTAPIDLGVTRNLAERGAKILRTSGRRRYGKDYKWIRIASLLAALKAMGVTKEKEKEEAKEE